MLLTCECLQAVAAATEADAHRQAGRLGLQCGAADADRDAEPGPVLLRAVYPPPGRGAGRLVVDTRLKQLQLTTRHWRNGRWWAGGWVRCVGRKVGQVCGQEGGSGVWAGGWVRCVGRRVGQACGQEGGSGVWAGGWVRCVGKRVGKMSGQG